MQSKLATARYCCWPDRTSTLHSVRRAVEFVVYSLVGLHPIGKTVTCGVSSVIIKCLNGSRMLSVILMRLPVGTAAVKAEYASRQAQICWYVIVTGSVGILSFYAASSRLSPDLISLTT